MGDDGKEENAIVTSTGKYVVAWDFAKVRKGQLDKYEIKWYPEEVVQDNFKFGDDKEIVRPTRCACRASVALPSWLTRPLSPPDCCAAGQRAVDQQEEPEATDAGLARPSPRQHE